MVATEEKRPQMDAQTGVLGSLLLWPEKLAGQIMDALTPEDFPDPTLRNVFSAARDLFLAGQPVDPVLIADKLGGAYGQTLSDLMELTPTTALWKEYARLLHDNRRLREIRAACYEIATGSLPLELVQRQLAQAAGLLVDRGQNREGSLTELVNDFLDRQADEKPPDFLDWGIAQLNEQLLIKAGRFVVIGADSSVGKTALALQFAMSFARSGKRVGFFSYETSRADLADRVIANAADVSLSRAKKKRLSARELAQVVDMGQRTVDLPLWFLETSHYTVDDIRAKTLARGYEVILIDYVQLINAEGKDPTQQVRQISKDLHSLSQELGVTVIGLSQVTVPDTDNKGKRRYITQDDLRESRQLKMDADAILLMDLSDPTDRDSTRVLIVAKNRDGPVGHFSLHFDPHRMRFTYAPSSKELEDAPAKARTDKMDENRAARIAAEAAKAAKAAPIPGQGTFEGLDGDDGELPF